MLNIKSPFNDPITNLPIEPSVPNEIIKSFQFPKLELPNPAEWAATLGNSFVDSINSRIGEIIHDLMVEFMSISTDICIIVGLIAFILYLCGWKKGKNVPVLAWVISIIIKIIGTVMLGV